MQNPPLKKALKLNAAQYFESHLLILNALVPKQMRLTEKEIEILSLFMGFNGDLIDNNRFNTITKRLVRQTLKLSHQSLANHLKSIRDKGVILKQDGIDVIRPVFKVSNGSQVYVLKLELDVD